MKALITGANGQLGQSILHHSSGTGHFTWLATDFPELDITSVNQLQDYCDRHQPEAIVNCAAYTAVDKAEEEEEKSLQINVLGPEILARTCFERSIPLVHISTDYVFPGNACKPYTEPDLTGPLSAYGKSKLEGENRVLAFHDQSIVLRTSWLYSEYGNNFVKTMIRLGGTREEIGVVADQIGCPTFAGDLAGAIIQILGRVEKIEWPHGNHLFHYCNSGVASWFDLAREVMDMAGLSCRVKPISTADYPLPAPRPFYSVMNTKKYRQEIGEIPYWKDSLRYCIEILNR